MLGHVLRCAVGVRKARRYFSPIDIEIAGHRDPSRRNGTLFTQGAFSVQHASVSTRGI